MMPHPLDRYELEKTRQQQVWETAEQDRQVREAAEKRQQRTAPLLPRVGALRGMLALWQKVMPAWANRRISSQTQAPARRCQKPAASALHHPRLQPTGTRHPHCA